MTRAEALRAATTRLRKADFSDPGRDARLLMRWAAGLEAASLSASLTDPHVGLEAERFEAAVELRRMGRPVSQIIGEREFWGRAFKVSSDVLDPRPETEIIIAAALEGGPAKRILDLGVGSGCILSTLLAEWPQATGMGVDLSAGALAIARENAVRLGVADRTDLSQSDWFADVTGPFDLIVANPPYISETEMCDLDLSVREFEPRLALSPGGDGLDAYRAIASGAGDRLSPGGRILLEVGEGQADAVEAIFAKADLATGGRWRDFDGRDRCILLHKVHEIPT